MISYYTVDKADKCHTAISLDSPLFTVCSQKKFKMKTKRETLTYSTVSLANVLHVTLISELMQIKTNEKAN